MATFPFASFAVTVTENGAPATAEAGATTSSDTAGPGVNTVEAVWTTTIESVVSVAAYVTVSAVVSLAVKAACPATSSLALAGAIVDDPVAPRLTSLPATGFEFASSSVTVTVAVATPSATTDAGAAETVEVAALDDVGHEGHGSGRRDGDGVGVCSRCTSRISAVVLLTAKVATPEAFVVALAGAIVELAAPSSERDVLPGDRVRECVQERYRDRLPRRRRRRTWEKAEK